eukprot:7427876-Prorocentrum_lima.AAC.1
MALVLSRCINQCKGFATPCMHACSFTVAHVCGHSSRRWKADAAVPDPRSSYVALRGNACVRAL